MYAHNGFLNSISSLNVRNCSEDFPAILNTLFVLFILQIQMTGFRGTATNVWVRRFALGPPAPYACSAPVRISLLFKHTTNYFLSFRMRVMSLYFIHIRQYWREKTLFDVSLGDAQWQITCGVLSLKMMTARTEKQGKRCHKDKF